MTIDLVTASTISIFPWADALVEAVGHRPDSHYVEWFWLPTLGPTAAWAYRRLNAALDIFLDGLDLDLDETAAALGVKPSVLVAALDRLNTFGAARWTGTKTLAIRRRLPPLSERQVARLPEQLRAQLTGSAA